jgi:hypothetical protein
MPPSHALLLAALRAAPRRFRLPPLPASAAQAQAEGVDVALAFAIEQLRLAQDSGHAVHESLRQLFMGQLAALIRQALDPASGDAAFRALVLHTHDAQVREHVRLAAQLVSDRRYLRSAVNAVAHPAKLRELPPTPLREALAPLHALLMADAWAALREQLQALRAHPAAAGDAAIADWLHALLAHPALQRLEQGNALAQAEAVRHYLALCELRGPSAGSPEAASQGRAAARTGNAAEQATVQAFAQIARLLDGGGPAQHGVARGLRTPRGFPGEQDNGKDEWDAALMHHADADAPADILLLAEVKASPAAAAPDLPRLRRGLLRLAQADAAAHYVFATADAPVPLSGRALAALAPPGHGLPAHVIYCSAADPEARPAMLGSPSRALLLAEPASLAFAHALTQGQPVQAAALAPVWEALPSAPQLRPVLHQHETAQAAREAMLHPQDLLDAVRAQLAGGA